MGNSQQFSYLDDAMTVLMHSLKSWFSISHQFLLFFIILVNATSAQSFNEDKSAFCNYLKRMYTATPFEGVKIVDDYDHQYLISVISLDKAKYADPSVMNRVSLVKAKSQANTFINGASITMDMVITTQESKDSSNTNNTIVETVEQIRLNSVGFTKGLELLTNFDSSDKLRKIFVHTREMKTVN
jgi:hypothetical protein